MAVKMYQPVEGLNLEGGKSTANKGSRYADTARKQMSKYCADTENSKPAHLIARLNRFTRTDKDGKPSTAYMMTLERDVASTANVESVVRKELAQKPMVDPIRLSGNGTYVPAWVGDKILAAGEGCQHPDNPNSFIVSFDAKLKERAPRPERKGKDGNTIAAEYGPVYTIDAQTLGKNVFVLNEMENHKGKNFDTYAARWDAQQDIRKEFADVSKAVQAEMSADAAHKDQPAAEPTIDIEAEVAEVESKEASRAEAAPAVEDNTVDINF